MRGSIFGINDSILVIFLGGKITWYIYEGKIIKGVAWQDVGQCLGIYVLLPY
jgi:hypothetical protein